MQQAESVSGKTSTTSWTAFAIVYLVGMAGGSAYGLVGPLVGQIAQHFQVSVPAVGGILICLFLPGVLFGTAIGAMVDRIGARLMLLCGAALLAVVDGLQLLAPSLFWFAAGLLALGVAISAIFSAGQVMVSGAFTGADRARGLTLWSTVNFLGYAAGLFLAGMAASGPGWKSAFAFHGLASGVAAVVALFLPRRIAGATAVEKPPSLKALIHEVGVLRISFALGLASIAGVGVNASISLYLHDSQHVAIGLTASAAAIGNIICIAGGLGTGWLLGKGLSPIRLAIGVSLIATAAGVVLFLPWINFQGAVATLYVYQICLSAITALTYAAMPGLLKNQNGMGAASGFLLQIGGFGAMLGPTLFFAVEATGDWKLLVVVIAGLWAASFLIFPKGGAKPALVARTESA